MRPLSFAIALVASVCAATVLDAQQYPLDSITVRGVRCSVWMWIPGGSDPTDSSYNRCALDRGARVLPGAPMPPAPRDQPRVSAAWVVTVKADGTVDSALTRRTSESGDSVFQRRLHESILQWRFSPGMRGRRRVRSGFALHVRTDTRDDTLPARLEWRYRHGLNADTLLGRWIGEPALAPFAPAELDSVYAATVRRLLYSQVVLRGLGDPYCIVLPDGDSAAHARVSRIAGAILDTRSRPRGLIARFGCERDPGALRLVLPRAHRTENGRVVLRPSGDHLPNYPRGFTGRSWRAWSGRCSGTVPSEGSAQIDCEVAPLHSPGELQAFQRQRDEAIRQANRVPSPRDSLSLTVIATTNGAWYTDTMHATVRDIPRLSERSVMDSIPPCGGWSAHSLQDFAALYIVHGDPTTLRWLEITDITPGPLPQPIGSVRECGPDDIRMSGFTAFILGDLGARVTEPVTLCYFDCGKAYVIDPARHTLAPRAHFRFRLADLRPEARTGEHLDFRIQLVGAPPGVVPFYILHDWRGPRPSAHFARRVAPDTWDSFFTIEGGHPRETEVYIYFFIR